MTDLLFMVLLFCCGRKNGVIGPYTWDKADELRESYIAAGSDGRWGPAVSTSGDFAHDRSGIIVRAKPQLKVLR